MSIEKLSVLKAHMSLTLKLPEVTDNIFREHEIMVDYDIMNKKANDIVALLKGLTVAEATLTLQEVLRETYHQLVIDTGTDTEYINKQITIPAKPDFQSMYV